MTVKLTAGMDMSQTVQAMFEPRTVSSMYNVLRLPGMAQLLYFEGVIELDATPAISLRDIQEFCLHLTDGPQPHDPTWYTLVGLVVHRTANDPMDRIWIWNPIGQRIHLHYNPPTYAGAGLHHYMKAGQRFFLLYRSGSLPLGKDIQASEPEEQAVSEMMNVFQQKIDEMRSTARRP